MTEHWSRSRMGGHAQGQPERPTYVVRFEAGPRDGTVTAVLGLESGEPPDILLTPGQPDWTYVLAGGPRGDGSLPYLHMPQRRAARVRARGRQISASRRRGQS